MDVIIPVAILSGLGLFFGIGLAYASRVFEVKVDERISKIREMLPGANCGACGFSGCDGLADAIVNEGVPASKCTVGGKEMVAAISDLMGVDEGEISQMVARVTCQGTWTNADMKFDYDGIADCHAANQLGGGMSQCFYGCIGLGSCKAACPFDAIEVINGLARVNPDKCTGCGKCVSECPKGIIRLVPVLTGYTVMCANKEKGGIARKNCKVSCIGCMKCQKACPSGAITVENNLAEIHPEKCVNCGTCSEVCPQSTIIDAMHQRFPNEKKD
jgi:electron transport complex protein RnfB